MNVYVFCFLRHQFIEYARFAAAVEEAVGTGSLEKAPLLVPTQHVPSEACERNFLNFEERQIFAKAMDKLVTVKHPNLEEIFTVSLLLVLLIFLLLFRFVQAP